jgi:kinetochore protein Mis13/DSN1
LYKHIDCDLLESARARQLLIWCSGRALSSSSASSPSTQNSKTKDKDQGKGKGKEDPLPPLTDDQKSLLRGVQEDLIKMLADKKIDTNVISHDVLDGGGLGAGGKDKGKGKADTAVKENEQNVRNRAREVTFSKLIEK